MLVDPRAELALFARGGEDHSRPTFLRGQPFRHFETVDVRELDVEEDYVRIELASRSEGRFAVGRLTDDLDALALEQRAGNPAEALVVIDDEDLGHARMVADARRIVGTGSHTVGPREMEEGRQLAPLLGFFES
jgi:hypothetical protein